MEKNREVEELQIRDNLWVAPPLWQSEFRSVTSVYLRKGLISFEDGLDAFDKAELIMGGFEMVIRSKSVLELVNESSCSSYDCEFVALARELQVPLVTYDKTILREFPETARTPEQHLTID